MNQADQHSHRAAELEGLLAMVKTRVQDLEDRCLGKAVQQLSHTRKLQQENLEMQVGKLRIICSAIFFLRVVLNMLVKVIVSYFPKETVSDSGAEAFQTERGNSTAAEETVFLR